MIKLKDGNVIFNLGLLFDEQTEKKIIDYSQELALIQNGPYTLGSGSTPHVTVLQFEAPLSEADLIWAKVEELATKDFTINFKGMVWDRWMGFDVWWIKVLKSQILHELQVEAMRLLSGYSFLNNILDRYEPHSTLLAYPQMTQFPAFRTNPDLTYLENLNVRLSLGRSGPTFQFAEQLFPN